MFTRKRISYYFLCLYVILFPIMEGLANEMGSIGAAGIGFGVAVFWFMQSLHSKKIRWNSGALFLLTFCLWMIFTSIWSANLIISSQLILSYVMIFVFYVMVCDVLTNRRDVAVLLICYFIGLSILSVTAFARVTELATYEDLSNRYSAAGTDPNNFGMMLAGVVPLVFFVNMALGDKYRFLIFPVLSLVGFLIFSTASRGAAISFIFALSSVFFQFRSIRGAMVIVLSISVGLILFTYVFIDLIPPLAYDRLVNGVSIVGEDDRFEIWKRALAESSRLFQGFGAGLSYELLGVQAHNTFVSSMLEGGVVALLLWSGFWFIHAFYLASSFRLGGGTLTVFLLFCYFVLLISAFTLNWEFRKPLYLLFAIFSSWPSILRRERFVA